MHKIKSSVKTVKKQMELITQITLSNQYDFYLKAISKAILLAQQANQQVISLDCNNVIYA